MDGLAGSFKVLQFLASQIGVVVVAETIGQLLKECPRHGSVAIFFGQAGTPVNGGGNFIGGGIECDLLLEFLSSVGVPALPQGQPRRLPMCIGRPTSIGKALL